MGAPQSPSGADPLGPGVRLRASARHGRPRRWRWPPDTHGLAILLGVLAALGILGAALSFAVDLFVAPWRLLTADGEESLHLVASVVGLAGAFRLERSTRGGKTLVLAGLALNVGATVGLGAATLGRLDTVVPMLTWIGLAVLTVLARRRLPAAQAVPAVPIVPAAPVARPEPPSLPGWPGYPTGVAWPGPGAAWVPALSRDGAWAWTGSGWAPARRGGAGTLAPGCTAAPPRAARARGCAWAAGVGCALLVGIAAGAVLVVLVLLAGLVSLLAGALGG